MYELRSKSFVRSFVQFGENSVYVSFLDNISVTTAKWAYRSEPLDMGNSTVMREIRGLTQFTAIFNALVTLWSFTHGFSLWYSPMHSCVKRTPGFFFWAVAVVVALAGFMLKRFRIKKCLHFILNNGLAQWNDSFKSKNFAKIAF